jgi:Na+/H+ antiporter NhaC
VRTQLPYALVAASIAMLVGNLPAGFGLSPWISLAMGLVAVAAFVRFIGRPIKTA